MDPSEGETLAARTPELDNSGKNLIGFSSTTIFSPVIRVIRVSGDCSTNLMRSEFTSSGLLFSRVR